MRYMLLIYSDESGYAKKSPADMGQLMEAYMKYDEELRTVLVHQVQQLFHRLIQTKNAIFRFREGMQVMLAYPVSLNITQLLLESARVHDEATREEPSHAPESPAAEAQESDGSESGEQKSASETENPEQADADEAPAESEHDEEAKNGKKEASGKGRKGK